MHPSPDGVFPPGWQGCESGSPSRNLGAGFTEVIADIGITPA
jgi:hypothetical protein